MCVIVFNLDTKEERYKRKVFDVEHGCELCINVTDVFVGYTNDEEVIYVYQDPSRIRIGLKNIKTRKTRNGMETNGSQGLLEALMPEAKRMFNTVQDLIKTV